MTYPLSTNVAPGDGSHASLHNQERAALNDLNTRSIGDRRFYPAPLFQVVSGAPTLTAGTTPTWPRWQLDPTTTEIVSTVIQPPPGWLTAAAYIWYVTEASGTGAVVFNFRIQPPKVAGADTTASEVNYGSTETVPTLSKILAKSVALGGAGFSVATADPTNPPLVQMSVRRLGADAGDTHANDIGFVGVELRRIS